MKKTPTEEIQYLGQMLTATVVEDEKRLKTIVIRLQAIYREKYPMVQKSDEQKT